MKRLLYIIPVLLLITLAVSLVYVLSTGQGLKWVFPYIKDTMPEGLSIDRVSGRLIGPMNLKGITYASDDYTVTVDSINLDWKPAGLLFLQLHLAEVDASGVRVETRKNGSPGQESGGLADIRLPINIRVDNLLIRGISVFRSGSEGPFIIKEVSLKGDAGKEGVGIDRFTISTRDFTLRLQGKVNTQGDYPLNIETEWEIRPEGYAGAAGEGELSGTMKILKIRQAVSAPYNAHLNADLYDVMKDLRWEGDLSASDLSLKGINRDWPEMGVVTRIKSAGTPDSYDFSLSADITGTQVPRSNVMLSGTGTQNGAIITSMSGKLLDGTLAGKGVINWAPSLDWQVSLHAQSINPGVQWPDWPGELNMKLLAKGGVDDGPRVSIEQASVQGELRGHPLKTEAAFDMADGAYRLLKFELTSGRAHLTASGSYDRELDARWNIRVPELGELLPEGKGEISGHGRISGDPGLPKLTAQVKASRMSFGPYRAGVLSVYVDMDPLDRDDSIIDMSAENVLIDTQEINKIMLKAGGKIASHTISLAVLTDRGSVSLAADAGYKDKVWGGRMTGSELDLADFGLWKLKTHVPFSLSSDAMRTGDLCLIHGSSSACLKASWTERDGLAVNAGLSDIPLSLFSAFLPSEIALTGALEGSANISYSKNTLSGKADVEVSAGTLSYNREKGEAVTIPFEQVRVDWILKEKVLEAHAGMSLPERGAIKGDITLPVILSPEDRKEEQAVSGRIRAELRVLGLVTLFTSVVDNTKGVINTDMNISGTLDSPVINGRLSLNEGGLDVPGLNIHLKDLRIDVKAGPAETVSAVGRVTSGSGSVLIEGVADVKDLDRVKAEVHLKGEDFEAANTPRLRLIASPDITVQFQGRSIDVDGTLNIPEASMELPDLSDAVPVSDDVVIISESSTENTEGKWKISSRLELSLGEKVSFKGSGLSSRVTGKIHITEEPGRPTGARGELQLVDGVYKAYGQDLKIEKGRLIFAGLIDDPALDVRAVRQIKDVRAGILVTGTLKRPETKVFSVPPMDQSDALSYILFGRPMNGLSGSEGGRLYDAAASAGLSGGGFIAKKIGAAFGLEEVEIEKGETWKESALVIGKYLSPRLYVSYGIGLFEPINTIRMRYNLSKRWLLQTEYGIESSGDVLYELEH